MRALYLFVPWNTVAKQVGIPEVQAAPLPNLRDGVLHAVGLLPEPRQKEFHAAFREAIASIPTLPQPCSRDRIPDPKRSCKKYGKDPPLGISIQAHG